MENRKEPSMLKYKLSCRDSLCALLKLRIQIKWYKLVINMLESALSSMHSRDLFNERRG